MKCEKCNKVTEYGCFMSNCPVAKTHLQTKTNEVDYELASIGEETIKLPIPELELDVIDAFLMKQACAAYDISESEMKDHITLKEKREELINKFSSEFIDKYFYYDATFHTVFEMLVRGVSPFEIIEMLCKKRMEIDNKMHENVIAYGNAFIYKNERGEDVVLDPKRLMILKEK